MTDTRQMRRTFVRALAASALLIVGVGAASGFTYWVISRRFVAGDAHALDGVARVAVNEPVVFRDVTIWD